VKRALALLSLLALLSAVPALAQGKPARRGFSIAITEPKNDDFVLGKSRIAAEVKAESPDVVDRVEFAVGDKVIFVDRAAPFEFVFDFGTETRSYVIRATAWHREVVGLQIEEVNRVLLWATAETKGRQPVAGLKQEQFRVLEDGEPQTILDFYPEERPITLALVLDSSGSIKDALADIHEGAIGFIDQLKENDRALVIDFDDKVYLIQDLTADKAALKESASSTEAIGGTAIYDALHASFRKLRGIDGRKAIVLLTDGDDTNSQFPFDRVLEEAKTQDVLIYAIGLGPTVRKGALKEFCDATGGRAIFVDKAKELTAAYTAIAAELRAQYYLSYQSSLKEYDGRWVKIEVESTLPDVEVRAKRGYFAVRSGETVRQTKKKKK
jgi:VWFA-related protein